LTGIVGFGWDAFGGSVLAGGNGGRITGWGCTSIYLSEVGLERLLAVEEEEKLFRNGLAVLELLDEMSEFRFDTIGFFGGEKIADFGLDSSGYFEKLFGGKHSCLGEIEN
jgi:hypothetical protein